MKKLKELISGIDAISIEGDVLGCINGIHFDSRKIDTEFLFVAISGTQVDGHGFIQKAIDKGATGIVCEKLPEKLQSSVTYIQVENSSTTLGKLAACFYDNPSQQLKLIGVTGTNGKTTIASLLYQLFNELGYQTGLFSTIDIRVGKDQLPSTHTTPDAIALNSILRKMVDAGCDYCFMEVSSHSIDQGRICGLEFAGGVFTNLTHDHLDYHNTFRDYLNAKKRFFDELSPKAFALTNTDDKNGMVMLQNTKGQQYSYAQQRMADFKGNVLEAHFDGMLMNINGKDIWTHFVGNFNVSNLLAVYGTALLLGQKEDEVLPIISKLKPVAGRFETIQSPEGVFAVVDYAHTPDALKNVLTSINKLRTRNETLITVVGAGGDRDKTKRPEMAREATQQSDKVILTSDNPRSEEPEQIIADMTAGVEAHLKKKVLTITDRKEAIRAACMMAVSGDIIVVAGKGHETYQEVKGVRSHFDDREVIREMFNL